MLSSHCPKLCLPSGLLAKSGASKQPTAYTQTPSGGLLVLNGSFTSACLSLQDTVIILPRIVPTLRPVGKAWSKQTASNMYSDPQGWDLETVLGMLVKFLDVTHAASLPKLDEYRVLPDKVRA